MSLFRRPCICKIELAKVHAGNHPHYSLTLTPTNALNIEGFLFVAMEQVFRALCTDPTTGLPVDPRAIFMRLDTDGGGTVDIDEFRNGIEACGCELSKGILDITQ